MINLLPPIEKAELLAQKNKRLVIVLGNIALVFLICFILILFSIKFHILSEIRHQKYDLDSAEKNYQMPLTVSTKDAIKQYNASLLRLDDFYKKEIYISQVFKDVLGITRPNGIYFAEMVIFRDDKSKTNQPGKVKIFLSATSNTRDNLLVFKNYIEENKKIENVYFPPESWVKDKNISFNVTFETVSYIAKK